MAWFKKKKYLSLPARETSIFQDIDRSDIKGNIAKFRQEERQRIRERQKNRAILDTARAGYEKERRTKREERREKIRGVYSKISKFGSNIGRNVRSQTYRPTPRYGSRKYSKRRKSRAPRMRNMDYDEGGDYDLLGGYSGGFL